MHSSNLLTSTNHRDRGGPIAVETDRGAWRRAARRSKMSNHHNQHYSSSSETMWGLRRRGTPQTTPVKDDLSPLRPRKNRVEKREIFPEHTVSRIAIPLLLLAVVTLVFWMISTTLSGRKTVRISGSFFPRTATYSAPITMLLRETARNRTKHHHAAHDDDDDNSVSREIRYPMVKSDYFDRLFDSKEYNKMGEPLHTKDCEPQYEWQGAVYPTCNSVHELDMATLVDPQKNDRVKLIANGCEYIFNTAL
jgi:hypothetical protein